MFGRRKRLEECFLVNEKGAFLGALNNQLPELNTRITLTTREGTERRYKVVDYEIKATESKKVTAEYNPVKYLVVVREIPKE